MTSPARVDPLQADVFPSRDPQRIDAALSALAAFWKQRPDMRIGQLLLYLSSQVECSGVDLYDLEEDQLMEVLNRVTQSDQLNMPPPITTEG